MSSMSIHWVCLSLSVPMALLLLWPRTFSFCACNLPFPRRNFLLSSSICFFLFFYLLPLQRVILFFRFFFARSLSLVCRTFSSAVWEAFVMNHSLILSNRKCHTITMFSFSFCLSEEEKRKRKYEKFVCSSFSLFAVSVFIYLRNVCKLHTHMFAISTFKHFELKKLHS